jgi:alpha-tubulin suppressor-like RCC1 family protein
MIGRRSLCLALVALMACGGTEPKVPKLTTLTIQLASPTTIVGGTVQAAAVGADQDGVPMPVIGATWSSSNTSVATMSGDGLITAVGVGAAQISAVSGDAQGFASITVNPIPVATIEVSGPASGVVGEKLAFTAVAKAADGSVLSGRAMTWGVSDGARASMTQGGVVTVLTPGAVDVFASSEGVSGSATFTGAPFALTAIAAGYDDTCGIATSGSVFCWGENVSGKLGDGSTTDRTKPTQVASNVRFSKVFASVVTSCALTSDGAAYCWGANGIGQVGTGAFTTPQLSPVPAAAGVALTSMSLSQFNTCGVTTASAIACWGGGPFGDGSSGNSATPRAPAGGRTFKAVAAGQSHACALTSDGDAYCWGSNQYNQLGDGTDTSRALPVAVVGGHTFSSIVAGKDFTCALTPAGAAWCWGWNLEEELGDGTQTFSGTPVAVQGGLAFTSITAGIAHACGLTAAGQAHCWGLATDGAIGDGLAGTYRGAPSAVTGGIVFTAISAGGRHTCGITASGAAYCWGTNAKGALGDGTTTRRDVPGAIVPP